MPVFNILMVHGGEQGLDALKLQILDVLPELEDMKSIKTTDRQYLFERLCDEGRQFDAIIFTQEARIEMWHLARMRKAYRPREVVLLGDRTNDGITTTNETIFVVEKIKDWKTNLYQLEN